MLSTDKDKSQRRINFMADCDTVDFVKEQLGVQSLSLTLRKLLVIFANDKKLQARACSMNCDKQSDYERLQGK